MSQSDTNQSDLGSYTGTIPEISHQDCQRCGHYVISKYRGMFGDDHDLVYACPDCPDINLTEINPAELAWSVASIEDARDYLNELGLTYELGEATR